MGNISWLLLALQVKIGKVVLFVGKIFVVRPSTMITTNILPHENYQLYGMRYDRQRLGTHINIIKLMAYHAYISITLYTVHVNVHKCCCLKLTYILI